MRIGYFGGTFDPPHRAHLRVAQQAADAFSLTKVLLAPTGMQPLKQSPPDAAFADRLVMTRLLCGDDPRLEASDIDAPHPNGSPNYTVDALTRLQGLYPDADLVALAGADSFLTLRQWHQPDKLLQLAEWVVVSRPGSPLADLSQLGLSHEQRSRVHLIEGIEDETSASELRARLRAGVSCGAALPAAVLLYIARMHLYQRR